MTWFAIDGLPPQFQKANTGFANEYRLKFYKSGTTTPIQVAFNKQAVDDLGNTATTDTVRINEFGYTVNGSGGVSIPHVEEAYKVVLYKNATDANNNDTSRADFVIDGIQPGLIGFVEAGSQNAAGLISYQVSAAGADNQTVEDKLRRWVDVRDYGAIGNGVNDDSVVINTCISENTNIYFPAGNYLISGLNITSNYKNIMFGGNVRLTANANDTILFHQSASYSKHSGTFIADAGGRTGVIGMAVGPADLTDNSTTSTTVYNTLPGVRGTNGGCDTLLRIQNGPTSQSINAYNLYPFGVQGLDDTRILWLSPAASAAGGVPFSNTITGVMGSKNTGVHIESGQGNTILAFQGSGFSDGTTPNSTPTALIMSDTCPITNIKTQNNHVQATFTTTNTRDIDLGNSSNWVDGQPDRSKAVFTSGTTDGQYKHWGWKQDYIGEFNGAGVVTFIQSGWTVSKLGTGVYRVTHNLNKSNYYCDAQCTNNNNVTGVAISNKASNSFDISVRIHDSSQEVDADVNFIVKTN